MDPYQAGQQLGELGNTLFGAPDQRAYVDQLGKAYTAQNAMQRARRNRALAIIDEGRLAKRQQLPAALAGVYTDPKMAALADAVLGSNSSVNLSSLGDLQRPGALGALGDAIAAMDAGDFAGYNQQTAIATGKPYEPVRVAGGNLLPSGVGLGDAAFEVTPLPQTQAQIGASQASARAADARANLSNVKAAAGGFSPNSGSRTHLPSVADIKAVVGESIDPETGASSFTPDKLQQVYAWFHEHPGATLADYVAIAPVGSPGALPARGATDLGDIVTAGPAGSVPNATRKVVRTGTAANGRKVIQYDDGTVDYAD